MSILCTSCGYDQNPDGSEFCDACGAELSPTASASAPIESSPVPEAPSLEPQSPPPLTSNPVPEPTIPQTSAVPAKLVAKQPNAPIAEFCLDSYAIVGIFDPDTGPVDIDLEEFPGSETISRNHAEIYQEAGAWKIKDLGSTNGVFIKPVSQSRFGARITTPETIHSGDEVAIAKVRFLFQSA
ncbi:MAG: FHA domain-containing protein [Cyanophyceae cyanobacterium]